MMERAGLISLLFCFVMPLAYADPTLVYQISEGSGVYLQTTLTHDIYRYSSDSQLNDVVVIDNQGNRLPSNITTAISQVNEEHNRIPLTFFPVAAGAKPDTWIGLGKTLVSIDDNVLSISSNEGSAVDTVNQAVDTEFYLLDMRQLTEGYESLSLDWQKIESDQFLEVHVSGTDDLQNWIDLAQETLVHLQKNDQVLSRNQINLSAGKHSYDYVKVKFLRGGKNVQLLNIYAHTKTYLADAQPLDIWRVHGRLAKDQYSILGAAGDGEVSPVAAWEYHRDDRAPVTKLQISLGESAYGDNVKIFSRTDERKSWELVRLGIWFNARFGKDWQHSEAISFSANTDPHWRIELHQSMRDEDAPVLVFEHSLHTLRFIASNAAPYSIAIDPDAESRPNAQIFSQLVSGKTPDWIWVNSIALNPAVDPVVIPAVRMDWKIFLFWGLLLFAVVVLIGFAVRLYREMR